MSSKGTQPDPQPQPLPDPPPGPWRDPDPNPLPGGPRYADQAEVSYLRARVAHLERQLADARRQAHTDPLTGVLNRAGLADHWWRVDPVHKLALVDLDHFKRINDTHGHAAGDQVLTVVAALLRTHGTVARLGGDELVVVGELPGGPERGWRVPLPDAGPTVWVTGSVGVTRVVPGDLAETLRRADVAMYRAKRAGAAGLVAYDPVVEVPPVPAPARRRVRDAAARPVTVDDPLCGHLPGERHDDPVACAYWRGVVLGEYAPPEVCVEQPAGTALGGVA